MLTMVPTLQPWATAGFNLKPFLCGIQNDADASAPNSGHIGLLVELHCLGDVALSSWTSCARLLHYSQFDSPMSRSARYLTLRLARTAVAGCFSGALIIAELCFSRL